MPSSLEKKLFGESTVATTTPVKAEAWNSFSESSSMIDALMSNWTVYKKNGDARLFEYFSELRAAVSRGDIRGDDEIVPVDGRRYLAKQYPGLADLFGNNQVRTQAQRRMERPVAWARPKKTKTHSIPGTIALVLVAALVALAVHLGPGAYRSYELGKGRDILRALFSEIPVPPSRDPQVDLEMGMKALRSKAPMRIADAKESFLSILVADPENATALSSLAEAFAEEAYASRKPDMFSKSEDLIRHAEILAGQSPRTLRARARLLWRQGKTQEGLEVLRRERDLQDPNSSYLLFQMHLSRQDFTSATIQLQNTLNLEPANEDLLLAFTDLFETQGKYDQAASYLRRVYEADPSNLLVLFRLADTYKKAGDSMAAEALYKGALRRGAESEALLYRLVSLLADEKRNDQVLSVAFDYFELYPQGQHILEVRQAYDSALALLDPITRSDTTVTKSTSRSRRRRR